MMDAVVAGVVLIEHVLDGAMDDVDDADVEVTVNLDEVVDNERSEDDTSTLHNAQGEVLHNVLFHRHHFYIR